MIRHIVMLKLKPSLALSQKQEICQQIKQTFENLHHSIKQIRQIEVGLNFSDSPFAHDVIINSVFETENDLHQYYSHPAHLKAVQFNRNYTENKAVVDYHF